MTGPIAHNFHFQHDATSLSFSLHVVTTVFDGENFFAARAQLDIRFHYCVLQKCSCSRKLSLGWVACAVARFNSVPAHASTSLVLFYCVVLMVYGLEKKTVFANKCSVRNVLHTHDVTHWERRIQCLCDELAAGNDFCSYASQPRRLDSPSPRRLP